MGRQVAMMSRITIDLKKQSSKLAFNLGKPKRARSAFGTSMGMPPVSDNTMMFQRQETQRSLDSTQSRESLSGPHPSRLFTEGDVGQGEAGRTRGMSASTSRARLDGNA